MKKIIILVVMILILVGCSSEDPFGTLKNNNVNLNVSALDLNEFEIENSKLLLVNQNEIIKMFIENGTGIIVFNENYQNIINYLKIINDVLIDFDSYGYIVNIDDQDYSYDELKLYLYKYLNNDELKGLNICVIDNGNIQEMITIDDFKKDLAAKEIKEYYDVFYTAFLKIKNKG